MSHGGHAHWRARMTGIGFECGIDLVCDFVSPNIGVGHGARETSRREFATHRQETDSVDTFLINITVSHLDVLLGFICERIVN